MLRITPRKLRPWRTDMSLMRSGDFALRQSTGDQSQFAAVSCRGGTVTVRPAGPSLGQREAPIIADEVRNFVSRLTSRYRVLLLDLSQVQIMTSLGLGLCIELRNAAHKAGARTILFGLTQELDELFRMMKIERLYTVARNHNDLARALAA